MSNIVRIIAILLKMVLIGFLVNLVLSNVNPKLGFLNQNWVVWIFLYFPIFIGYESIISLIFNNKDNE